VLRDDRHPTHRPPIVARCPKPVFLAGGLRPDNVRAAVATVRPAGVDLCSGVRIPGRLDAPKLTAFVTALRGAS
jgi:phosphoribosylanthranilate isomerase